MGTEAPVMTLRGTILFPGAESTIFVGRAVTVAAVRRARAENDALLAVFTQVAAEKNDGVGEADVYRIGTLCRIEACVELQDQSMKLLLVGVERIALTSLRQAADGALIAAYEPARRGIWSEAPATMPAAERDELVASLSAWAPELDAACELHEWRELQRATELPTVLRHARALVAVSPQAFTATHFRPGEPEPAMQRALNEAVACRQRILEADDAATQLALLRAAMDYDRSTRTAERSAPPPAK